MAEAPSTTTTPTPPTSSKPSFTSPRIASKTEAGEALSVKAWLDNIKKGWGDKYGDALEEGGGYEDVDDILAAAPSDDELKEFLAGAGAKRPQLVRISTAIRELCGIDEAAAPPNPVSARSEALAAAPSEGGANASATWKLLRKFACFLSHFKFEAATEARLCQIELEKMLGAPCFLDSDNLQDLRELLDHVRNSDVLVLLQTTGLLTRPWCLLEIVTAIKAGVPIVAINVKGSHPYDYGEAANFLEHLDTQLEEKNPGASQLLLDQGIDLTEAAYLLSSVLPNIISTELLVSGSRNVIAAQLSDVVACMSTCKPLTVDIGAKDAWLEKRSRKNRSAHAIFEHGKGGSSASAGATNDAEAAASDVGNAALSKINREFKIAVGYSFAADAKRAATESYRQLRTKLSNSTPNMVVAAVSGVYDFRVVCETLRDLLPTTTPIVVTHSGAGVVVDGQYLNEEFRYMALQGVHDPDGIYKAFGVNYAPETGLVNYYNMGIMETTSHEELLALETDVIQATKDAVTGPYEEAKKQAVERNLGERPQYIMSFASNEFKEAALSALMEVVGGMLPIVGGASMLMDPTGVPGVAYSDGSGHLTVMQESPGMAGFICWPSVHASGAFCCGLQADPECKGGIVTKMRGRNVIEEIDNQPASEVVRGWMSSSERMTDEYIAAQLEKSKQLGFGGKAYSWMDITSLDVENGNEDCCPHHPLGAVIGVDESSGEEIHKLCALGWVDPKGGFSSMVGVDVGTKMTRMMGRRSDSVERTARVASQVVKNTGVDLSRVVGAFSYSCGMNMMYGGRPGMNQLAETLSDRLGWVPTLGICGGPEFGCQGDQKSCVGSYMYSCVVFTNVPVDVELSGQTFASISKAKRGSMALTNHGSEVVTEGGEK